jgi:GntR family transcriptional regulator
MASARKAGGDANAFPVASVGPLSLRGRTYEALLEAIRERSFVDGKLPAENELAARMGVSRTTLRAALQMLEHDGIVSRRRRTGTRIVASPGRPFQLDFNRLAALDDLLRERGHEPTTRILGSSIGIFPEIAAQLGLAESAAMHSIEKMWYADDRPAAFLRDYIPCSIIDELPKDEALVATIFALFSEVGPERIELARVELIPKVADAAVAERLDIDQGEPYLRLWQRHFGGTGRFLAVSRLDVNDQFVRLAITRRL